MLPNCPQYVIATFAILRLGAIVVNINPSYTAREVLTVATDSGIRVLVTLDALAPLVQGIRDQTGIEHVVVTSLAEYSVAAAAPPRVDGALTLADLIATGRGAGLPLVEIAPGDLAVLQYTGGTTGTPKGAMLTHANIFANVVQMEAWQDRTVARGAGRYLVVIPYFHIYAFSVVHDGGDLDRRVAGDSAEVRSRTGAGTPSGISGRRTFPPCRRSSSRCSNHPKVGEFGLEHVRTFNSGGAPCPVEVIEEFERRIGRPLHEGYGLSETSPVTHSTPHLAIRKPGTIGLPVPETDIKVVDIETGTRELPLGEAGELCIAGPQVMKGYWNKPEESACALRTDADGRVWFHTGDIARVDEDGFTSIVQRKKDMIIVDGFNVYPSEVESVLYTHPAVRLAAVIGVPDAYHGEVVKACIAFKPGASATADELLAFCRGSLTEYKVPRLVDIRETLPMSAVGKILYRVLRDER